MNHPAKLATHRRTMAENTVPVVFCVKCGGTCIDQNSLTELACYTCGNVTPWNADNFSIRRGLDADGEHDVINAFRHADLRLLKLEAPR